jgi:hypothetical protein
MDTTEPMPETSQDQGCKQKGRENVDIFHALTRVNAATPSLRMRLRSSICIAFFSIDRADVHEEAIAPARADVSLARQGAPPGV